MIRNGEHQPSYVTLPTVPRTSGLGKPVLALVERQRARIFAPELGAVDRDALRTGLGIGVAADADIHFMPRWRGQAGINRGGLRERREASNQAFARTRGMQSGS